MLLCADLGGTHARFALFAPGQSEPVWTAREAAADHPSVEAAAGAALRTADGPAPTHAALAVAAPVGDDPIAFTNNPWRLSRADFAAALGLLAPPLVMNDFSALAWGLTVQDGPRAPRAVIGPGTGFGVGAAIPHGDDDWTILPSQGGHAALAPSDADEAEILDMLRRALGRVSAETVLSGPGIVNLAGAIAAREGRPPPPAEPAAAIAAAPPRLFAIWSSLMGGFAGDVALTLGARGGVTLTGGVLAKLGDRFDEGLFRKRFEEKGKLSDYVMAIETRREPDATALTFAGLRRAAEALHTDNASL